MNIINCFVKGIISLSLIATFALAEGDHEAHDVSFQDLSMKSSIQLKQDTTEMQEQQHAKLGVSDIIPTLKSKFSGKITTVKLENIDGNLVYTVEVLAQDNSRSNVLIDAGNGKILAHQFNKKDHNHEESNDQENEHDDS
ncbi:PepSY domain-containing protein [Sulfurospirillum sp. 1612]|uniref:PepSY domain-containing protein n=1 Tax=Sulfurospirillum sp. 1612 TaxID=3094835 RepID=UPI002F94FEE7